MLQVQGLAVSVVAMKAVEKEKGVASASVSVLH